MLRNTTTPRANALIRLLGGYEYESVTVTSDELNALLKLYGITRDEHAIHDAGNIRNMFRATRTDGLRLMAFIAKYLEKDQDPVAFMIDLMVDAGYDVDPEDWEWACEKERELQEDPT